MDGRPYLISIDSLLTDEEQAIWQAAHDFCERKIAPVIEEHYENATFPHELIPEFAEMGFLGAGLEGYGCAGMNPVAYGLVNLSAAVADKDDRWRVTAFVKNLFDQSFASSIVSGGPGGSFRYIIPREADRYVGVTARLGF